MKPESPNQTFLDFAAPPPPPAMGPIARECRRESYSDVQGELSKRQREVLEVVRGSNGRTPWEVASILDLAVYVVRPRMTELADRKILQEVGKRLWKPTGKNETVYRAVPELSL